MGRLENSATFIPPATHFLSRLRSSLLYAEEHGASRLTKAVRCDLGFWMQVLETVHKGIDINLVVRRKPDHVRRTDACEYGIGGYSVTTGLAWRWELPEDLRYTVHINFLEFLSCVIDLKFAYYHGEFEPGDCILSMGDSTTAAGWLHRSNFMSDDNHAIHRDLARELGLETLRYKICNYSLWFAGRLNVVGDACSRMHALTADAFTNYIKFKFPTQVPDNFRVLALPSELSSEAESWVRRQMQASQLRKGLTPNEIWPGPDGNCSASSPDSVITYFSLDSEESKNITCSAPLLNISETANIPNLEQIQSLKEVAERRSGLYLRPLSTKTKTTPAKTPTERLRSFYYDNTKASSLKTSPSSNNRPFR